MANQKYLGNGNHEWQRVTGLHGSTQGGSTMRLRVPGGWLYNVYNGKGYPYTQSFVPLPEVVKHAV